MSYSLVVQRSTQQGSVARPARPPGADHAKGGAELELEPEDAPEGEDYAEVFRNVPDGLECVQFSAGNPSVEHITGLVHLFRDTASMVAPSDPHRPSSSKAAEVRRRPDSGCC